jgi:hypothetical protein
MYFLLNVSDADRIRSRRSCLTGQHAAAIRPLRKEFIEGAGASYDRKAARSLQMTRGTPKVFTKQMARRQYASAGSYEATLPGLPWPAQRASGRDCRGEWPPRDRAALPRLCAALTRPRLGSPAKIPGPLRCPRERWGRRFTALVPPPMSTAGRAAGMGRTWEGPRLHESTETRGGVSLVHGAPACMQQGMKKVSHKCSKSGYEASFRTTV